MNATLQRKRKQGAQGLGRPMRPGDPLTHTQAAVMQFILESYREYGVPPTVRDIMLAIGSTSPNGAMSHIRPLVAKGYLARTGEGMRRCFVPVVPEGCCPCCGRAEP